MEHPGTGEIWKHKRKGTKYLIIIVSNTNSENPEFIPMVTFYDRKEDKAYSRPLDVFLQKFENARKMALLPIKIYTGNKVRTGID